jgi:uncharacterized membrane protein
MSEILSFLALAAITWCAALSLVILGFWSRKRQLEQQVSQLLREVRSLSAQLERLCNMPVPEPPHTEAREKPAAIFIPAVPAITRPPVTLDHEEPMPERPPPPQIPQPPPSTLVPPRPPAKANHELEALIGGNWLLKIGIFIVVLGAVYFLKYAFDNRWIGNWGRVGIGAVAGAALLGIGELFHRKKYPLYGQVLMAGGLSILYLSIYAAFNFYALLPVTPAFAAMALVTAAGSLLSSRHESKTLALMSLAGGLLTPVWLSTGRNNEIALLGYLFILDLGMGWLARRRGWLFLNAISLGGTAILFYLWAVRYYGPSAMWVTEGFLVLFAVLYVFLSWNHTRTIEKRDSIFGEPLTAATVLLFFTSSSAVLGPEPFYYWCFLLLFDALMLRVSLLLPEKRIAPTIFLLNGLGVFWWISEHYELSSLTLVICCLSGVFLLFLAEQILRRRQGTQAADLREILACMGTGFGYFGASYYLLHVSYHPWMGAFAVALAGIYFGASRFLFLSRETARPVAQAFLGLATALLTLAIPIQMDRHWITIGWAAEAAILTWIGFAVNKVPFRRGGFVILSFCLIRLMALDAVSRGAYEMLAWNGRVFAFLGAITAVYVMAWLYRRHAPRLGVEEAPAHTVLILLASLLSVLIISIECWTYYTRMQNQLIIDRANGLITGPELTTERWRLGGLRQLTLSILWSIYSMAAVIAGIRARFRPIRLFGIALFFLTIFKIFSVDIWSIERLYRIISTLSVGLVILAAAFLYHRFKGRISGS